MTTIEIICAIIGATATILTGMWFIVNKATKGGVKEHRLTAIEKKTEHANCKNNSADLLDIKRWIMKLDDRMIDVLSEKYSPRRLNSVGIEVIKISGAHLIIDKLGDQLVTEMETKDIKTAFDAEVEAYFTIVRNDHHEVYNTLKSYVYNQPSTISVIINGENHNVALDYDTILHAIGLVLRDRYLEKHPELQ